MTEKQEALAELMEAIDGLDTELSDLEKRIGKLRHSMRSIADHANLIVEEETQP